MSSIFAKIINGDIPCYKLAEDESFIAFLDINPIARGHCLVVPKVEVDYFFDLEDQTIGDLHIFAKKVAIGLKKVIPCIRVGSMVIGTEVPHAHLHLIPFNTESQVSVTAPKLSLTPEEMKTIATEVSQAIVL